MSDLSSRSIKDAILDNREKRIRAQHAEIERLLAVERDLIGKLHTAAAGSERLRAALAPFAEIGQKIAHAVGGTKAFPPGASVRFLDLEPLCCQDFVDARNVLNHEQVAQSKEG